ncbi:Arabinose 5-phosphate isomerase KdsD,D-arabinose 5-phosphate isomerase,Predicted signal-transduction protein containing cAMP-binding and CBS domains,sugar isomerase, KpsF/GutQ family,SIS domain [Chlamydia serpentis]|uniref:Arabinose 5-phosphate isomerase KdsD,D-arabinose 5-phosphate isomerase,Predicted signal-transduction protein containing cAMP-binding and CBS domains,sugar isomerase, KpsF/GutQ family,SIS domain n=1 Tax=Chlamydia serpentis TaxID=1967782 RepID=A0A2R8FB47_9CHLA|nr:KpsF/GutQ family sugar-phosphate isomerase [Chlamydia serpentis]SPN73645.1 Arabinose 5-phosphate isomerase KdsD,D-arabinose 5-phosphate isomerase,Predicted signal-transduction protein containing cAMP-binding and CBS domains,sugar isomerase, KpsF/GutQ family,SIS domain [Chlamydia serpentis]
MNPLMISTDVCQDILSKQKESINFFFQTFQSEETIQLVEKMLDHSGWVFFSGVGKSGCVARKVVATLQSLSERSLFLSPIDLLHGDLGLVNAGDFVCLFSKSGETQELLNTIPHLKNRGVIIVGITSVPYSNLAALSDLVIILPSVSELDPFNLIPTNSTTCQMIFGDFLAMLLFHGRGISLSAYGHNHPSGQIGMKANGKVKDFMFPKTEVPFCNPEDKVGVCLEIISAYGCGCVCVINSQFRLIGIFTDGDLRRSLACHGGKVLSLSLSEVMTPNPRFITEDADIAIALQLMETNSPVAVLPVLDNEENRHVTGLLHMHTLAKAGLL